MTKEQIEYGNIQIAKMVGAKIYPERMVIFKEESTFPKDACISQTSISSLRFHCDYRWLIGALRIFFNYIEQNRSGKGMTSFLIQTQVLLPLGINWKKYYTAFLNHDIETLFEGFIYYAEWYNKNAQ